MLAMPIVAVSVFRLTVTCITVLVYRVGYSLQFQASTGGLTTYSLWIKRYYCNWMKSKKTIFKVDMK